MIDLIIKYYAKITDMALSNLAKEKTFQWRKHLTNHSLMQATESHYWKYSKSEEATKLITDYKKAMNDMYKNANVEYNNALKMLKATDDPALKQKILNNIADNGFHGFTAKNGARWNIETYSNMYSRHVNNEMVRLSVIEEAKRQGKNVVKVSSHGTICELCKPFEGKILTLAELEAAKARGLFHPNCLHFLLLVVGGI
jgi:hypothetical protein